MGKGVAVVVISLIIALLVIMSDIINTNAYKPAYRSNMKAHDCGIQSRDKNIRY